MQAKSKRESGKSARKSRAANQHQHTPIDFALTTPRQQKAVKPLEAKTERQQKYMSAIDNFDIIFGIGPAGTGKTFVAAAKAAQALADKEIETIIITRPAVAAEEEYGFLPGDLDEKFEPYLAPVRAILEERLGAGFVDYALKSGQIKIAPLGFLRGHTFKNAWVIFDEAQNSTPNQMKLFLTRIGEDCKVIIDGDLQQMDIQGKSGLLDALDKIGDHRQVKTIEFTNDDIVRSGLAKDIILAYQHKDTFNGHAPRFLDNP